MASFFAKEKAAAAWCTLETRHKVMDNKLAGAFAGILDQYIHALRWCGGSKDFQEDGIARKGWDKVCRPLLES